MNLLDIRQHKWSKECLNACGNNLEEKLSSKLVYPRTALGTIAKYFVGKYGFDNQCQIVSCTGDNPSSYYALASDPKTVVISLGTSDTVMASIPASAMPKEAFDGHLLVNPLTANPESNLLMLLLCFKNGSLVRERVRQEIASKDWKGMSELIGNTSPSNDGFIGFFYDDPEILPQNIQGRFYFNAENQPIDDLEPAHKARAVLESQCLAKRLYLQKTNVDLKNNVDQIVITGGASVNADLAQIIADIFAKPVYAALVPNSGALGGALRAVDVINQKPNSSTSTVECQVFAQPRNEYSKVYDELLVRYAALEDQIVKGTK
jgi:xylulokinase